jgi:membrane protease YdiL (CAAX protease family)
MIDYFIRVTPATLAVSAFLFLLPKKFTEIRIVSYIYLFVVFRDAMTPTGLWEISPNYVLRFHSSPAELVILGITSALLVFIINWVDPELKNLIVYFRGNKISGTIMGALAAILIAAPALIYYRSIPESHVAFPATLILSIFALAMFGNFLEEVLFRGYFQGYLEQHTTSFRAALLSGLFFAVAHASLATTVTPYAIPILGFTLYEGLVAAFLRRKYGVFSATLAHGGAIFLIASGIL